MFSPQISGPLEWPLARLASQGLEQLLAKQLSHTRSVDIPPSTPRTCPVIQLLSADNKNLAIAATSAATPIRFSG